MQCSANRTTLVIAAGLILVGCSKSDEYYEMLGEQGQVSRLLAELDSDNPKVRAKALTGIGVAAACADPTRASNENVAPVDPAKLVPAVDPAKLVPAVDPAIKSLRDEDGFVQYCAGYALRYLAESVNDTEPLNRVADALIEHMPRVKKGDNYRHYVDGLEAIAARAEDVPELAAKARAALDTEHNDTAQEEAGGKE